MSQVTVEDLDRLVEQIKAKEDEIEAASKVTSGLNKELQGMFTKANNYLRELGREDYKTALGTVKVVDKWNIKLPPNETEKMKLFAWMREQGIYDKYATVHAGALKSLFMAEWEEAKKRGEGLIFSLPGMEPPTLFQTASFINARTKKEKPNDNTNE